jgi:hypothetical protein
MKTYFLLAEISGWGIPSCSPSFPTATFISDGVEPSGCSSTVLSVVYTTIFLPGCTFFLLCLPLPSPRIFVTKEYFLQREVLSF